MEARSAFENVKWPAGLTPGLSSLKLSRAGAMDTFLKMKQPLEVGAFAGMDHAIGFREFA